MKRAALALVALALLLACGAPVTGTVVSHNHRPAWVEHYAQPIYSHVCFGTGTTRTCTQSVVGYYPASRFHDERWDLIVKDAKGKNHTIGVHQQTYLNKPVGSSFTET